MSYKNNLFTVPYQGKIATFSTCPYNHDPPHTGRWFCCQNQVLYTELVLDWSKDHPSSTFQHFAPTNCEQKKPVLKKCQSTDLSSLLSYNDELQ